MQHNNFPNLGEAADACLAEMEAEPGNRLAEVADWRMTHTAKCLFLAYIYSRNPFPAVNILLSVWSKEDSD